MSIVKIALTGGPCGGKTTGIGRLQKYFTNLGYKVMAVDETATRVITGGGYPWESSNTVEFQKAIFKLIRQTEESFELIARTFETEKVLIICDRGTIDSEAYMSDKQIEQYYKELGVTKNKLFEKYDGVFHLVTAANGAEKFYSLSNNEARTETIDQAREKDTNTLNAWIGHPHLRIIDNRSDFETKMAQLIKEVASILGEPLPYEIEKKFLIEKPDLEIIEKMPHKKVEIVQFYLKNEGGTEDEEVRIRQRGDDTGFTYTKTYKKKLTEERRIEIEERLTAEQYIHELSNIDSTMYPIRKTRYCIPYDGSYLEIDIYPEVNGISCVGYNTAVLEIELYDENAEYHIPDFIHIGKEVTDDKRFKNKELAKQGLFK